MRFKQFVLALALVLSFVGVSFAQVPDGSQTARDLASQGYFDKCAGGEIRACSYFARLVAYTLNPNGNTDSWGWLSKLPGESGVEGYADDAIVYTDSGRLDNVVDMVGGAGLPGARIQWGAVPRRPSNTWVRPRPLTAAEMEFLKPGSGGGSTGGGGSTPTPTNLQPILDAIAQLRAVVDAINARTSEIDPVLRATHDYARDAGQAIQALAARPTTVDFPAFPTYRGSIRFLGQNAPITLTPQ